MHVSGKKTLFTIRRTKCVRSSFYIGWMKFWKKKILKLFKVNFKDWLKSHHKMIHFRIFHLIFKKQINGRSASECEFPRGGIESSWEGFATRMKEPFGLWLAAELKLLKSSRHSHEILSLSSHFKAERRQRPAERLKISARKEKNMHKSQCRKYQAHSNNVFRKDILISTNLKRKFRSGHQTRLAFWLQ